MREYWLRLRRLLWRSTIRFEIGDRKASSGNSETIKFFRVQRSGPQDGCYFEVLTGPACGRRFTVDAPIIRIGRAPENHIYFDDPKISRFHAEIRRRGASLFLKDLHSTNGTLVNGKRLVREIRLKADDQISIGDSEIQLFQPRAQ
jgi:pSer/pThr/pTyr-binding forkhead associated (FHA) protein